MRSLSHLCRQEALICLRVGGSCLLDGQKGLATESLGFGSSTGHLGREPSVKRLMLALHAEHELCFRRHPALCLIVNTWKFA